MSSKSILISHTHERSSHVFLFDGKVLTPLLIKIMELHMKLCLLDKGNEF